MAEANQGAKTALNQAIRETSGAMHVPPDLFGPAVPAHGGQREGAGRPKGARNKRTGEMARFYLRRMHQNDAGFADPLLRGIALAGKDLTDEETIATLARLWACDRAKVVELCLANWRAVMPYIHQEQPRSLHLAPGVPDSGELAPVEGELPTIEGDFSRLEQQEPK